MALSSTQFKLIRREKDPKFNIDVLEHYNLLLQLGFSDIQVCITDSRNNKIMLLEDYALPGVDNQEERVECLESLFDDHHLLLAGFWNKIKVLVKNKKFALVPDQLFIPENTPDYIRLNASIKVEHEQFFHNRYKDFGFVNVFSVNKHVTEFLIKKIYPKREVQFYHQSSALIEGYQKYFSNKSGKQVALYIDRFVLHICVFEGGLIRFYNHYPIKKFDDYFKYITIVSQEFSVKSTQVPFYLWGYLAKNSKHFASLQGKYPGLRFGSRPPDLKLSYVFDEIPEHQYFDLLSFNYLS